MRKFLVLGIVAAAVLVACGGSGGPDRGELLEPAQPVATLSTAHCELAASSTAMCAVAESPQSERRDHSPACSCPAACCQAPRLTRARGQGPGTSSSTRVAVAQSSECRFECAGSSVVERVVREREPQVFDSLGEVPRPCQRTAQGRAGRRDRRTALRRETVCS